LQKVTGLRDRQTGRHWGGRDIRHALMAVHRKVVGESGDQRLCRRIVEIFCLFPNAIVALILEASLDTSETRAFVTYTGLARCSQNARNCQREHTTCKMRSLTGKASPASLLALCARGILGIDFAGGVVACLRRRYVLRRAILVVLVCHHT
jgi:hypothetical protein